MQRSTLFWQRMLPTAMALGTAWAARGQVGHEYGATWAAAIGILALITLSGREDWYKRLPVIVALGAIAWGAGGMISYGIVVGYGHSVDFFNTAFGLFMLMIIGALYGFMGGGITGLALESHPAKKPDWAALITQMFAGGFLFWGLFINQLDWLMTPPRSELWAGCMGASLALGWYLYRNGYSHALRTAFFSALGAGFGFAFGNFLQRMGQSTGISFNWWNVMEYSIGFFGGLGMAYGVYSSKKWPATVEANKVSNGIGWVFLVFILPFINLVKGASAERMTRTAESIEAGDPTGFAFMWQLIMWAMFILFMAGLFFTYKNRWATAGKKIAANITLIYLAWYILFSNFISAIWLTPKFVSQHLYWINWLILAMFLYKPKSEPAITAEAGPSQAYTSLILKWWLAAVIIIIIAAYVAVTFTTGRPNANRF